MTGVDPLADRCPRCTCADCGGRLDQHTETGCACPSCADSPSLQCDGFLPDEGISFMAEQLGWLLSVHLGDEHKRRCRAVAYAANHALRDYDSAKEARRG